MCVFARHNFLKDPPFAKMDFISCRNVLIYMEPFLQKKAFTTFHYALNEKGFLLLGKIRNGGKCSGAFSAIWKEGKNIYQQNFSGKIYACCFGTAYRIAQRQRLWNTQQ